MEWTNAIVRLRAGGNGDDLINECERRYLGKTWLLVGHQLVQAVLPDGVYDLGDGHGEFAFEMGLVNGLTNRQWRKAVTHPRCAWMIVGYTLAISAAKTDWWSSIKVVFATMTSAHSTSIASEMVPVPA